MLTKNLQNKSKELESELLLSPKYNVDNPQKAATK
jgi:hypothetical protein